MKSVALVVALLASSVNAVQLTLETWENAVKEKSVFVKFHAPW